MNGHVLVLGSLQIGVYISTLQRMKKVTVEPFCINASGLLPGVIVGMKPTFHD
jgi:hypothetical protein